MQDHTLVLRLAGEEDPTVAQVWERCQAAAAAFAGELVGWETGDALQRNRDLQENLRELKEKFRQLSHGPCEHLPVEQATPATPGELVAAGRVAGEVAHTGRALEWPDPRGTEDAVEQRLVGLLRLSSPASPQRLPTPLLPDPRLARLLPLLVRLVLLLREHGLRIPDELLTELRELSTAPTDR